MSEFSALGDKASLRAFFRAARLNISPEERQARSRAACVSLLAESAWHKARCVALYMAVRGETDCAPLLEEAWLSGRRVLLPLCSKNIAGSMRLVPCAGPKDLRPGAYGIPEPRLPEESSHGPPAGGPLPGTSEQCGHPELPAELSELPDLIVTPGVAFDRQGRRLGAGGGYYDRLFALPALAGTLRIGLAFAVQIVDQLPHDAWDQPLHGLCSEEGMLWIHKP